MKIYTFALLTLVSFSLHSQDYDFLKSDSPDRLGLKVRLNGDCYKKDELQREIQNQYVKFGIQPTEFFEVAMDVVIQCTAIKTSSEDTIGYAVSYNMRFSKFLYGKTKDNRQYVLFDEGGELNIRIAPPGDNGKNYAVDGIKNNVANLLKKYRSVNPVKNQ